MRRYNQPVGSKAQPGSGTAGMMGPACTIPALQNLQPGDVNLHGPARNRARARRIHSILFATAAALTLAACEPGTGPFSSSPPAGASAATSAAQPGRSTRTVERDVEAPQVFQVTEDALWDGRPSLGGVWVAAPNVPDPERVIMRNQANGKFVIGALFKREADNPGPKLQISSDAAEALGLLAGQPAKLSVTALRREEASAATPEATPDQPVLDSNESLAVASAPVTTEALDAGGVSSTALPAAGETAAPASTAKKTRREQKREAEAAAAAATLAAAEAKATPAPASGAPAVTAPAPTSPGAAAATTAAAAASTSAAPAASGRTIQIGFFSQEANATRARDQLAKAGVTATVRKESSQGKDYWTVFTRGDAALLQKVKSAGFADAYLLK